MTKQLLTTIINKQSVFRYLVRGVVLNRLYDIGSAIGW